MRQLYTLSVHMNIGIRMHYVCVCKLVTPYTDCALIEVMSGMHQLWTMKCFD